jgi:hypothetical protein
MLLSQMLTGIRFDLLERSDIWSDDLSHLGPQYGISRLGRGQYLKAFLIGHPHLLVASAKQE